MTADIPSCPFCGESYAAPVAQEPAAWDADAVRTAFERSFRDYFGRGKADALFDQPAEFWLGRTDEGQYEIARVNDAWTGWLAAARCYAHFESLFRVAKLGHEQAFAECQRLAAPPSPEAPLTGERIRHLADDWRNFGKPGGPIENVAGFLDALLEARNGR